MAEKKELPMAKKKQSGCGCGCIASPQKDAKEMKPAAKESKK
jgi:hypothetical protein